MTAQRYSLGALESALSSAATTTQGHTLVGGPASPFMTASGLPDMDAAARSGLEKRWFDELSDADKDGYLAEMLALPAIIALADTSRGEGYLKVVAAAARSGAPRAFEFTMNWAKTSRRYDTDDEFDRTFRSFTAARPGDVTIGTLIDLATKAGWEPAPWRQKAAGALVATVVSQVLDARTPLSAMPNVMAESNALNWMNDHLAHCGNYQGTACYISFEADDEIIRRKPDELRHMFANRYVRVPGGRSGEQYLPIFQWWATRGDRNTYDRAIYDPENKRAIPGERVLNLWRDFAVTPSRESCRRMLRHVWRILCGRDWRAFKYLIWWLAHLVQHPGTAPGVMIVIRSDIEGVGKSMFGQWICTALGVHGIEIADPDLLLGQFNATLDCKSFVLLEEPAFPGDHARAGKLKALLTGNTLTLNPKGSPTYTVPNPLHLMMTTNMSWAVPAGAEARRFLVLDVREKRDRAYFDALGAEAANGGIATALFHLMRVNLKKANLRDVPTTKALVEQQRRSADDIWQWISDAVVHNCLVYGEANNGFSTAIPGRKLYDAYMGWVLSRNGRAKTAREFGRALGAMELARGAGNNPPKWTIPDAATLLAKSNKRAGIRNVP